MNPAAKAFRARRSISRERVSPSSSLLAPDLEVERRRGIRGIPRGRQKKNKLLGPSLRAIRAWGCSCRASRSLKQIYDGAGGAA